MAQAQPLPVVPDSSFCEALCSNPELQSTARLQALLATPATTQAQILLLACLLQKPLTLPGLPAEVLPLYYSSSAQQLDSSVKKVSQNMSFPCSKPSNGFLSCLEQKPKSNLLNNPQDLTCPGLACLLLLFSLPPLPPPALLQSDWSRCLTVSKPARRSCHRGFPPALPSAVNTLPTSFPWFAPSLHPHLCSNVSSSPRLS